MKPACPPSAVLFFADRNWRPCDRRAAVWWCWEGGPTWYLVAEHEPPFKLTAAAIIGNTPGG